MEKGKIQKPKSDQWAGGRDWPERGIRELFAMMAMPYILIVVVVTQLYHFSKLRMPHLNSVNFNEFNL